MERKDENPKWDNVNPLKPDYTSFHLKEAKSWARRMVDSALNFIGIQQKTSWFIQDFKNLLETITIKREHDGRKGDYVEKIVPEGKFIIWGDIQGALHSLVRCLTELHTHKIIDEDLRITNENDYVIFTGDLINRSPYSLEVLTIVLRLMEKNPGRIVYIRGNHERNKLWHNYNLKQDLQMRAQHLSDETIPLGSLVDRFFNTLPHGVYLKTKDKTEQPCFVRLSHDGIYEGESKIKEDEMVEFLLDTETQLFDLKKQKDTNKHVDVKVLIRAQGHSVTHDLTDGLLMLAPEKGATTWSLLSAPTTVYQKLLNFYFDAFCIMQTTSYVDDWTIILHNRDIRTKEGFKKKIFNLVRGIQFASEKEVVHFSKNNPGQSDEIVIGSINDFTKGAAGNGMRVRRGLAIRLNKANRERELPQDRYVKLVMLDDEYTPAIAVNHAEDLMKKYKGDIVILTVGSPTHEALMPYMKKKELLVLFNFGGAMLFRTSGLTYNVHYRASYEREAAAMIEFAVNTINIKTFGLIYQNDSFGMALRNGARAALRKLKKKWMEASYNRNTLKIDAVAEKILEYDPEAILWFGVKTPFLAFIQKVGVVYTTSKLLMGSTFLSDLFRLMIKPRGLNVMITRVVADPFGDTEIAKEYRKAVKKYSPGTEITVDDFEAYIGGSLLIEAIKRIKNGFVTKERILEQFHNMKNLKYKGLDINYDPETQELGRNKDVWVDTATEWVYIPKEKTAVGQDPSLWDDPKPEELMIK